ncbi:MAG: hypothetical protein DHS80DRAFT_22206 [Piptocephalis tieghemiana]|nr:MAG: hypothetical protein DHS80DRAFT_22206 [Piptocephalis tieghemiana]
MILFVKHLFLLLFLLSSPSQGAPIPQTGLIIKIHLGHLLSLCISLFGDDTCHHAGDNEVDNKDTSKDLGIPWVFKPQEDHANGMGPMGASIGGNPMLQSGSNPSIFLNRTHPPSIQTSRIIMIKEDFSILCPDPHRNRSSCIDTHRS